MSRGGFQHVRSSTSLIAPDRIMKIDLVGQNVNSVAVDGTKNVSDALARIGRKLRGVDLSEYGIYEYLDQQQIRELSVMEVLADVKQKWDPSKRYRFVFAKRAADQGADKWKEKLSEQQKKINRISQRMSARRSKKLGGESYADKLKMFEIEQLEKRMTALQGEMERNAAVKAQEEAEEEKRKKEEKSIRRKTMMLENKFAELEKRAGGGGQRFDPAKALETERKLKEVEDRLAARAAAKEKELEGQQNSMLAAMEKRLKELESELETDEEDISESEMQAQLARQQQEAAQWEAQLRKQRAEREAERERKKKEREAALDSQKSELEQKLKLLEEALTKKQQKRDEAIMSKKQLEVSAMEKRMADLEAALKEGDQDAETAIEEQKKMLSIAERDRDLSLRERMLKEKEEKMLQLEEKTKQMDELFEKMKKFDQLEGMINQIKSGAFAVGPGGGNPDFRSADELKKEIEECQKILMSGNASDKEIEDANIKLEKALDAYEKTPEFIQEQEQKRREKEAREAPKNKAALTKMKGVYTLQALKTNPTLLDKVRKYPELRLIMMDGESIMKKHENDFKMFVLNGLDLEELRAIRGALPKFRNDQKVQVGFVDRLDTKIDESEANASKPKPVKRPAKKLKLRTAPAGAPSGDLFAELLAKRGGGAGGLKKSSGPQKKSMAAAAASGSAPGPMPPLPPPGPDAGMGGPMPPLPPPGPDPNMGVGAPAPPPAPAASGPPPNGPAEVDKLKSAADKLASSVMGNDEKAVAGATREVVTSLKSVSALCKGYKPDACAKLDSMASVIVMSVKKCLAAKKAGDDQFITAQASLAQVVERLKGFAGAVL